MADKLIIVSRRPGMNRGGVAHPAVAEHPAGKFTPEQLADIVAEPEISVVEGGALLTPAILAARAPKADTKKK